jgi:cobalt-zinc-cadmium efflux system membrane fusion protein
MTGGGVFQRLPAGRNRWLLGGLAALAVVVVLVLTLSGIGHRGTAESEKPTIVRKGDRILVPEGSAYRKRLDVEPVGSEPLRRPLEVPAVVEADPAHVAHVLPQLGGQVVELEVALGDRVKQGQVLATIASPDLAQAYDDDDKARSAVALALKAYDRQRGVTGIGAGADKELEAAEDAYNQAYAEARRTEARLKALLPASDINGKDRLLRVRAPMSGSVTELDIAPRDFINDPTQQIMTVAQIDMVWVTASVPEKDLGQLQTDHEAEIRFDAFPAERFTGTVRSVSDVLEPDTRRLKVRIPFDNPAGRIKPNMFARVTFMRTEIPQLVLPTSALLMNNDSTTVFVEVEPWTFVRRVVQTEYQFEDKVAVVNGLNLGERVLVRGGVLLND